MTILSESLHAVIAQDQPIGWTIALVTVWTVAIGFIILALAVCVPPIWSAGLAWMRSLLPKRGEVIDMTDARRETLRRVMRGRP